MSDRACTLLRCCATALLLSACVRGPGRATPAEAPLADAGPTACADAAAAVGPAEPPAAQQATPPARGTAGSPPAMLPGACASFQDSTPTSILLPEGGEQAPVSVQPDPGFGSATLSERVDLNGDGREDLLLRFPEGCNNYGECPIGIYVDCGEGAYGRVWGPDYAVSLEVKPAGRGWPELEWIQRGEGNEAIFRTLRFEQGAYQERRRSR